MQPIHATTVLDAPDGRWTVYCLHCGEISTERFVGTAHVRALVHAQINGDPSRIVQAVTDATV